MDQHWAEVTANRINTSIIPHFTYNITKQRLVSETLVRKGGECLVITGASRIGKTSIAMALEELLNPTDCSELMARRPVVRFTCRNRADKGQFSTKAFYLDALEGIGHPFFTNDSTDLKENMDAIRRQDRETNSSLEAILENILKLLRTKYLIIDETQHLRYMVGGVQSSLQMLEFFKTLAEKLDIVLIFIGAYPIVNVMQLSPHLLGRTYTIEMKRYRVDCEHSARHFEKLLGWYSADIQFEAGIDGLSAWQSELFQGSLGIVGLLSAWIRDAMAEMLARGDEKLALRHFEATRKPMGDLEKMLQEIVEGEAHFECVGKFEVMPSNKQSPDRKGGHNHSQRPFQAKVERRTEGGRL